MLFSDIDAWGHGCAVVLNMAFAGPPRGFLRVIALVLGCVVMLVMLTLRRQISFVLSPTVTSKPTSWSALALDMCSTMTQNKIKYVGLGLIKCHPSSMRIPILLFGRAT